MHDQLEVLERIAEALEQIAKKPVILDLDGTNAEVTQWAEVLEQITPAFERPWRYLFTRPGFVDEAEIISKLEAIKNEHPGAGC